jgi:hypothetical protein
MLARRFAVPSPIFLKLSKRIPQNHIQAPSKLSTFICINQMKRFMKPPNDVITLSKNISSTVPGFAYSRFLHAQQVERENETVKKMWKEVQGTCEILWEILVEVNECKQTVKLASMSADKAAAATERARSRLSILFNKLKEYTSLINEMKDENNDEMKTMEGLRSKVDEYDVIINCMEHEYEEKCNEYQAKISLIEACYNDIIAKNSP